MIRETENRKSGYTLILLFTFLLGALMTTIYLQPAKRILESFGLTPLIAMLLLLSCSCMMTSSVPGTVLIPAITVLFGSAAALELDAVKTQLATSVDYLRLTWLLVLLPLYFTVCSWGISYSSAVRAEIKNRLNAYGKNLFISYTVMLIGLALLVLCRCIMII